MIPFNIPYTSSPEKDYVSDVIENQSELNYIYYTDRCKALLKTKWGYEGLFLTSSCTSALEISALLLNISKDDEVIIPSYTFPSTANAFIRQGARIVFADSRNDRPGIDEDSIESLITERTRAIVPVHYAGVASDMDKILNIAEKYKLFVVEDAAHGLDGFYKGKPLGSLGHIGCLSFHRTKNIQCGEGGAILINDKSIIQRVPRIIEKGTNRKDFDDGKTDHYEWVDIGSSYGISELHAACLYGQLEESLAIKKNRKALWNLYYSLLKNLQEKGVIILPLVPDFADHNAHIFYVILENASFKYNLKAFLAEQGICATTHYTPLNKSQYWESNNFPPYENKNSQKYYKCLLRLPLFNDMIAKQVRFIASAISDFYKNKI